MTVCEVNFSFTYTQHPADRVKIITSSNFYDFIKPFYKDDIETREVFFVTYLNRANHIIAVNKHSTGGTCGTMIDIAHAILPAIQQNAKAIILSHNHPSGNTTPSAADKEITKRLKEAAAIFDISVIDHVIITESDYLSFTDEGII